MSSPAGAAAARHGVLAEGLAGPAGAGRGNPHGHLGPPVVVKVAESRAVTGVRLLHSRPGDVADVFDTTFQPPPEVLGRYQEINMPRESAERAIDSVVAEVKVLISDWESMVN